MASATRKYINPSFRALNIKINGRSKTLRPFNYRERFGGEESNYILELTEEQAAWYVKTGALTTFTENKGKMPDFNKTTTPEEALAKAHAERESLKAAAEEQAKKAAEAAKLEAEAEAAARQEAEEAKEREVAAREAREEAEAEAPAAPRPPRRAPPPPKK
jgi:hypothetical protein